MEKYDVYNQSGKKVGEIERRESGGDGCGGCAMILGIVALAVLIFVWTLSGKVGDSGLSVLVVATGVIIGRGIYLYYKRRNTNEFGETFFDLCTWGVAGPLAYACIVGLLQLIGLVPGDVSIGKFFLAMIGGAVVFFLYSMVPAAIVALILKALKPKQ